MCRKTNFGEHRGWIIDAHGKSSLTVGADLTS